MKKVWAIIMVWAFAAADMFATVQAALAQTGDETLQAASVLVSDVQVEDLVPLTDDFAWHGGYYHSSMTEDGILGIVNCCAARGEGENGTEPAFRKAFAAMASESAIADYQDSQNQSLTEKLSYPAYDVTFTTGANEDTCLWKMILFQTESHTYAYAFRMDADYAEEMEELYLSAVSSLALLDASATADDPSARGESLEDFIAFFDTWYQYGDLNAESIRINGDGTWAYYNALNDDGTGGYLYDDGTFLTSGTTVLQLYSADGSHGADVSLNEYGELMLTPVSEAYAGVYADAAFIRASESIAFEPQPVGE